jgi:hypothetical protein
MVPGDSGMNLRGGALLGQIARSGDRGPETGSGRGAPGFSTNARRCSKDKSRLARKRAIAQELNKN